ncbi:MAG TPA: tripartite tricarboxylate transporter substrate binding protein, partial [Burkholderiales bacterium]|nr:tripartite tricarboxylate transporter substrate binding protein [Burkholderiales bacterium]
MWRNTAAWAFLFAPLLAAAQAPYPARPILMVVPFSAGSGVDTLMRPLTQKMAENMGQAIVIENQTGAAGLIGAERLKKAPPDGYTLGGFNDGLMAVIPGLKPTGLPYDPLKDYAPVSLVASISWVLVVNPEVAAKNLAEFIALARARPGQLNFSSGGSGSPQHVGMELFKAAANVDLTHIPYRGTTQATLDVIGGQIPAMFSAVAVVSQQIKAGKLRALAVASAKRSPLLPDVPTIDEAGVKGFTYSTWSPIIAPAGTPKAVIERLNAEVTRALNDPGLRERLIAQGLEPMGGSPELVTQWTREGIANIGAVGKRAHIVMEF